MMSLVVTIFVSFFRIGCHGWDLELNFVSPLGFFYLFLHKLRYVFSTVFLGYYELVSKFSARLKTLMHQYLSELDAYCRSVFKFKQKL